VDLTYNYQQFIDSTSECKEPQTFAFKGAVYPIYTGPCT